MHSISKRSKSDIRNITATPTISFSCEIFYTIICIVFASACNSHCQVNTCRLLYRTLLVLQGLIFLGLKLWKWNMNRVIFWTRSVRYRSLWVLFLEKKKNTHTRAHARTRTRARTRTHTHTHTHNTHTFIHSHCIDPLSTK